MGKTFNYERAEQEANKIGLEFAHSNDVVKDMSRAYNVDFSNIKVHTDSAADNKVKAAGKDALAQGNDIFFGKGIFESSDPADKGLVAHEFAHTMQQGAAMGGEMAVAESAPMGAAQGGIGSWFKRHFGGNKNKVSSTFTPLDAVPMAPNAPHVYTPNVEDTDEYLDMAKQIMVLSRTGNFSNEEINAMLLEIAKAKRASLE